MDPGEASQDGDSPNDGLHFAAVPTLTCIIQFPYSEHMLYIQQVYDEHITVATVPGFFFYKTVGNGWIEDNSGRRRQPF